MLIDCGRTDRERSKNGGTHPSSDGEKWLYRKDLGRSTESERECDSNQLNLSESAIRNYIRGRNLPTVDCMLQMCKLFHLDSVEELLVSA